jgi:hypothetical protein
MEAPYATVNRPFGLAKISKAYSASRVEPCVSIKHTRASKSTQEISNLVCPLSPVLGFVMYPT